MEIDISEALAAELFAKGWRIELENSHKSPPREFHIYRPMPCFHSDHTSFERQSFTQVDAANKLVYDYVASFICVGTELTVYRRIGPIYEPRKFDLYHPDSLAEFFKFLGIDDAAIRQ